MGLRHTSLHPRQINKLRLGRMTEAGHRNPQTPEVPKGSVPLARRPLNLPDKASPVATTNQQPPAPPRQRQQPPSPPQPTLPSFFPHESPTPAEKAAVTSEFSNLPPTAEQIFTPASSKRRRRNKGKRPKANKVRSNIPLPSMLCLPGSLWCVALLKAFFSAPLKLAGKRLICFLQEFFVRLC